MKYWGILWRGFTAAKIIQNQKNLRERVLQQLVDLQRKLDAAEKVELYRRIRVCFLILIF